MSDTPALVSSAGRAGVTGSGMQERPWAERSKGGSRGKGLGLVGDLVYTEFSYSFLVGCFSPNSPLFFHVCFVFVRLVQDFMH